MARKSRQITPEERKTAGMRNPLVFLGKLLTGRFTGAV